MNNKTGMRGLVGAAPLRWLAAGLVSATLAACGGGSDATGTLRVALTDAPACGYDHVFVTVDKIRVHQSSSASDTDAGWSEMAVTPSRRIDLLNLTNGALEELGSTPLPAGSYQQIRLVLADNNPSAPQAANALVLSSNPGTEIPLQTPSGQQSGLKLQAHFDVIGGQLADVVLDFDACKSVVKAGNSGSYNLKPVVSVFKRLTTAIVGFVDPAMAGSSVVSAQQAGVPVRSTVPDSTGKFTIAWLPVDATTGSASYTVVVAGTGRATAVVTGVPVATSTGTTQINTALAPIVPASSAMAGVSGTVKDGSATPLTNATVRATQALSGGPTIELAYQGVNAVDASYALSLPLAAPVKAPYVAGSPLSFTADSAVAGKYSLQAAAPGYTTQTIAVTLSGSTTQNFVLVP